MTEPLDRENRPAPRIAIVGPLLPYRGGIAQYNTLLARSFADADEDALFVSFSRQYPRWLYPGKQGDTDPLHADHCEPGALYLIDSINPLSWLKAVREMERRDIRTVAFHWWTVFWAPCFMVMIRLMKRRVGTRVVLICHNLVDHEASGLKAAISRRVIDLGDAYLVHSREHAEILRFEYPEKPVESRPIPAYGHFPKPRCSLQKRGRLELLFFGFIRPYKGIDVLLEAMRIVADEEIYLTVIGEHWGDSSDLVRECEGCPNIELRLEYVNDEDAAEYFARADVVVLPYVSATGSGVVALAYHYLKPVLASRVGGLEDAVVQDRTGWLVPPGSAAALADALRSLDRTRATGLRDNIKSFMDENGWAGMTAAVVDILSNKAKNKRATR